MAYRNKVYVCFDGDTDMHYYRLMQAWHQNDHSTFSFNNAHDLNSARDSSLEASIKAQLNVRLANSKVMVVLIGERTRYLYKFVRWEMEQALKLGMPIIAVNLNNLRAQDSARCPDIIKDELVVYVSFRPAILQHALESWPDTYAQLKIGRNSGPYFYENSVYDRLGVRS